MHAPTNHFIDPAAPDLDEEREAGYPPNGHSAVVRLPDRRIIVTYVLMGLTVLVYLGQLASQQLLDVDVFFLMGSKINSLIASGEWWRLFTPMLLHGSIMHIGFNMYALYLLGPGLERFYGRARFLGLYLLAGFAGNVFSMIFTPAPSLGSSTAIFGLLGAQAAFLYQNRRLFGGQGLRALQSIAMVAGINFIIGLSPGIDNWGHLGGLIGGGLFAVLGGPVLAVRPALSHLETFDSRPAWQVWAAWVGLFLFFAWLALTRMG